MVWIFEEVFGISFTRVRRKCQKNHVLSFFFCLCKISFFSIQVVSNDWLSDVNTCSQNLKRKNISKINFRQKKVGRDKQGRFSFTWLISLPA